MGAGFQALFHVIENKIGKVHSISEYTEFLNEVFEIYISLDRNWLYLQT